MTDEIVRGALILVTIATLAMATYMIVGYRLEILPMRRQLDLFAPDDDDALHLHQSITAVALAVALSSAYSLAHGLPTNPFIYGVIAAFCYQGYAVRRFYRGYRRKLATETAKQAILAAAGGRPEGDA